MKQFNRGHSMLQISCQQSYNPIRILFLLARVAVFCCVFFGLDCSVSNAQGFTVGYGTKDFTISPGETINGSLSVSNLEEEQMAFSVTLADYIPNPDGKPGYRTTDIGICEQSIGMWTEFSPDFFELAAGETQTVNYTISIPDNSTLSGSFWGAFLIAKTASESEMEKEFEKSKNTNIGLNIIFEYAIVVYTTIDGTQQPEAKFQTITIDSNPNETTVIAAFNNSGNTNLRPDVWMEITDVTGQMVYKSEGVQKGVLPNSTRALSFSLAPANLTPGEYMIMVIADYGVPQMVAAQVRVTITEAMVDEREAAAAEVAEEEAGDEEGGGEKEEVGETGEGEPEAE